MNPSERHGGERGGDDTPAGLLRHAVASDASRPLITFYDDTQGGARVELSVATFDNWVAKTANLLTDGLAAEPGERVALLLPPHWQTAVWLFGCWSAGLVARPLAAEQDRETPEEVRGAGFGAGFGADPGADIGADIVVAGPDDRDAALRTDANEVVVVSLHPLGAPLPNAVGSDDRAGVVVDYASEVRGYGDRFVPYQPVDAAMPALQAGGRELSGAELVAAARDAAARWGLDSADRVLTTEGFGTLDGVLASLLAPLAAGASVVLCRTASEGRPDTAAGSATDMLPDEVREELTLRAATERVTAVAGNLGIALGRRNLPLSSGTT